MAVVTSIIRDDAQAMVERMGAALEPLAGSTILVTGAAGFVLSYLLDVIVAFNQKKASKPCRVIAVDNFKVGLPERVAHLKGDRHIRFISQDVNMPLALDEPADLIIHGAGIASPTFYRRYPLETIDVNVNGTRRLLETAREKKARSIVFLSTSEIYGDPAPNAIPTPETYRGFVSSTGPRACYDESKRLGETLCMTYFRLYGTPVKMVRPFNVYGPGQRLDDRRIIPDLMDAALHRKPIVLLSDGRATRSFCYIGDFVGGLLRVLISDCHGEAFNIGNDEEISMGSLAECMAEIAAPPRLPVEYRASQEADYLVDNPQRRCPDISKMRSRLSWRPEVPLREGLSRTLSSYREEASK